MPNDTKDIEISNEEKVKNRNNLLKLVRISEDMVVEYSHDKLGKSADYLRNDIKNTNIDIDYSLKGSRDGYIIRGYYKYQPDKRKGDIWLYPDIALEIKKGMPISMYKKVFEAIGVIIHEIQHKFSREIATGEISKQLDEGFSDIFAESCIIYYLDKCPERLEEFGFELDYLDIIRANYKTHSAYIGENDFVRTTLEAINQRNGRAHIAEQEYIFGDKDEFLEMTSISLGEDFYKIINLQKNDEGLAGKYNFDYNDRLFELVKKIPIKKQDDEYNIYWRRQTMLEDIANINQMIQKLEQRGIDIYNIFPEQAQIFSDILKEQRISKSSRYNKNFLEEILQKYVNNCETIEDVLKMDLSTFLLLKIHPNEIIQNSSRFSAQDLLKFVVQTEDYNIPEVDRFFTSLKDEIGQDGFKKLDKIKMETIIRIVLNSDPKDENLYGIIKSIDENIQEKAATDQLYINFAKLKAGKETLNINIDDLHIEKGIRPEETSAIIRDSIKLVLESKEFDFKDFNKSMNIMNLLLENFKDYLLNIAKKDSKGFKEVIEEFKKFEKNDDDKKSEFSKQVFLSLKGTYFDILSEDFKKLKEAGFTISQETQKYIEEEKFSGDVGKAIRNGDIYDTIKANRDTHLISVFNKRIVLDMFEQTDSLVSTTTQYFDPAFMDQDEMNIYLKAVSEFMDKSTELDKLINVVNFTNQIHNSYFPKTKEEFKLKEEVKNSLKSIIEKRENPVSDLVFISEMETDDNGFVLTELVKNLENRINNGQLENIKETHLKNAISAYEGSEYIEDLYIEGLTQKYRKRHLTTEQFLQENYTDDEVVRTATRTAYLKSIGKDKDEIQEKGLKTLQEIFCKDHILLKSPQYVRISDEQFLLISNEHNNKKVYSGVSGIEEKFSEEVRDFQNRKKKSIFSLFKRKEDRALIENTVIIKTTQQDIQALNLYGTGRCEIVDLNTSGNKTKIIQKREIESINIGNNGDLIAISEGHIKRQFLDYHMKSKRKNEAQIEDQHKEENLKKEDMQQE